jgi:hypothetical protein
MHAFCLAANQPQRAHIKNHICKQDDDATANKLICRDEGNQGGLMRFQPSSEIAVYLDEGILCTAVDLFLAQVICYAEDLLFMRSCDDPPHLERHDGPGAAEDRFLQC